VAVDQIVDNQSRVNNHQIKQLEPLFRRDLAKLNVHEVNLRLMAKTQNERKDAIRKIWQKGEKKSDASSQPPLSESEQLEALKTKFNIKAKPEVKGVRRKGENVYSENLLSSPSLFYNYKKRFLNSDGTQRQPRITDFKAILTNLKDQLNRSSERTALDHGYAPSDAYTS
jgi:hypothetical protein